jgi:hypothetical protein
MSAATLLALSPVQISAQLPPPPLDVEAVFPTDIFENMRSRWKDGKYATGVTWDEAPGMFTPDGRFGLSPTFRYAMARVLNDGDDMICPVEPERHAMYSIVVWTFGKYLGGHLVCLEGELSEPPHNHALLLTRDGYIMDLARGGYIIEPFRAYRYMGSNQPMKIPTEMPPPRTPERPKQEGRYISYQEMVERMMYERARA